MYQSHTAAAIKATSPASADKPPPFGSLGTEAPAAMRCIGQKIYDMSTDEEKKKDGPCLHGKTFKEITLVKGVAGKVQAEEDKGSYHPDDVVQTYVNECKGFLKAQSDNDASLVESGKEMAATYPALKD